LDDRPKFITEYLLWSSCVALPLVLVPSVGSSSPIHGEDMMDFVSQIAILTFPETPMKLSDGLKKYFF